MDTDHEDIAQLIAEGTYSQDELEGFAINSDDSSERIQGQPLREQDRFLPIANITKIMKKAIPDNGKVAKDARECVQECVSEFISFITSEASDRCHQEKRKTINGEDILFAMCSLGFDNYIDPLKMYLQKYRECTKTEKQNIEASYSTGMSSTTYETIDGNGLDVNATAEQLQLQFYPQGSTSGNQF
ncbi:uncharacterized protein LOC134831432 [Culicoides brevitarsis]|uniref:uncharacterized protein LOC134831432 n=1 Tax=Culicoides brevitarsis TaxID=469753 RepID=UPI00307B1B9B